MTHIALVQQRAGADKRPNVERGLMALETAAGNGAQVVCFPELAFEPFYRSAEPSLASSGLRSRCPGRPPRPSPCGRGNWA